MSTGKFTEKPEISVLDQTQTSQSTRVETGQLISLSDDNTPALSPERISSGSSSSVEILSRQPSSDSTKSPLQQRLEKEQEEKKILEGKLKAYQTLGKLYQETKEELACVKSNLMDGSIHPTAALQDHWSALIQINDDSFEISNESLEQFSSENDVKETVTITGLKDIQRPDREVLWMQETEDKCVLLTPRQSLEYSTWCFTTLLSLLITRVWLIVLPPHSTPHKLLRFLKNFANFMDELDKLQTSEETALTDKRSLLLVATPLTEQQDSVQPEEYLAHFEKNFDESYNTMTVTMQKYFPERKCVFLPETQLTEITIQQIKEVVYVHCDASAGASHASKESTRDVVQHINQMYSGALKDKDEHEKKLCEGACFTYKQHMEMNLNSVSPMYKDELKQKHAAAMEAALEELEKERELDNWNHAAVKQAREELKNYTDAQYQRYVQENNTLSRETCQVLLEQCFTQVDLSIQQGKYTGDKAWEMYSRDKAAAIETYKSSPGKGPMANHVLEEYLNGDKRLALEEKVKQPQQKLPHNVLPELYMVNEDTDVISQVESICDAMCKSMDMPESTESMQIGKELIAFSLRAMKQEQQLKRYKTLIQTLYTENERLKQETERYATERETKRSLQTNTYSRGTSVSDTPSTSLQLPEQEWIHVVEDQTVQQGETQYQCDETTEREVEFQKKIKKLKEQTKELVKANSEWEKHCEGVQQHLKKQITSLMQELYDAKHNVSALEEELKNREEENRELAARSEIKLQQYEDQRTKAVTFASAQTAKVDELRKELRQESMRNDDLQENLQHLQSNHDLKVEENERLNLEITRLKSKEETVYQRHRAPETSGAAADDESSMNALKTENLVLKQQVTIYKEDFDTERRDREKAQSELSAIRNTYSQYKDDIKIMRHERKSESEALRAAREQDRVRLQKKQDEVNGLNDKIRQLTKSNKQLQREVDTLKRKSVVQPLPVFDVPRAVTGTGRREEAVRQTTPTHYNTDSDLLPEAWKRQIQSKLMDFTMGLRPDEVIIQLYSRGIVSLMEKQNLECIQADYKKSERLMLDTVLRGTKSDLAIFKQVLHETNHLDLALALPGSSAQSHRDVNRKWKCVVCTYENTGNKLACEMCKSLVPKRGALVREDQSQRELEFNDLEWVVPAPDVPQHDGDDAADDNHSSDK